MLSVEEMDKSQKFTTVRPRSEDQNEVSRRGLPRWGSVELVRIVRIGQHTLTIPNMD